MAQAKGKSRTKPGTSKAAEAKRKQLFAIEYLRNGRNGYRAAIKVGISPGSAPSWSWAARQDPKVIDLIKKHEDAIIEANVADLNKIVATAAEIAAFDISSIIGDKGEMLPPDEWPEHAGRVIASIEIEERFEWVGEDEEREKELVGYLKKIKTWSKTQAVEQLLKVLGGYEKDYQKQAEANAKVLVVPSKDGER